MALIDIFGIDQVAKSYGIMQIAQSSAFFASSALYGEFVYQDLGFFRLRTKRYFMNLIHFGNLNKFVCFIFHLVKATFAEVTGKPEMAFLLGKFSS